MPTIAPFDHPLSRSLGKVDRLTAVEERDLAELAQDGDKAARDRLILCNVPLALGLAKRWARKWQAHHHDDFDSFAVLGLIRAVETFDPSKGRFTTYATHWIRQVLHRNTNDEMHLIRTPVYLHGAGNPEHLAFAEDARQARAFGQMGMGSAEYNPLSTLQDTAPTPDDHETGCGPNFYGIDSDRLENAIDRLPASMGAIIRAAYLAPGPEPSLTELGIEFGIHSKAAEGRLRTALRHLGALLDDRAPWHVAIDRNRLRAALAWLDSRQAEIISLRIGLDADPVTLDVCAARFKICRERVRQIERDGTQTLRKALGVPEDGEHHPARRRAVAG